MTDNAGLESPSPFYGEGWGGAAFFITPPSRPSPTRGEGVNELTLSAISKIGLLGITGKYFEKSIEKFPGQVPSGAGA